MAQSVLTTQEELFIELEDLVSCIVCLEVPRQFVIQCKVGHHVCCTCKELLEECPLCKSTFTTTRNFAVEKISKLLDQAKDSLIMHKMMQPLRECISVSTQTVNNQQKVAMAKAGVSSTFTQAESTMGYKEEENKKMKDHKTREEGTETRKKDQRNVFRCSVRSCMASLPLHTLISHVKLLHMDALTEFQVSGLFFAKKLVIYNDIPQDYSYVLHAIPLGLFFLNITVDEQKNLSVLMQMASGTEKCKMLISQFKVLTSSTQPQRNGKVWSSKIPKEKLGKNAYIYIDGADIREIHHGDHALECFVGVRHQNVY